MKAFVLYDKDESELRKLCRVLQDIGTVNCTFEQFKMIYHEWHLKTFKGCPVSYTTANFRRDWFSSFVEYLTDKEI